MALPNGRQIRDYNFTGSVALPSGAGTSTGTAFDLIGGTRGDGAHFPDSVTFEMDVPADTALVSGATRVYSLLHDSASSPTGALAGYSYTVTGTAGNGASATISWKLPNSVLRYLAPRITGGSSGSGDSTALKLNYRLLF